MIVIDSSALVAIVNREPERANFLSVIAAADRRLISAATVLEAKIVVSARFGSDAVADLMLLIEEMAPDIVSVDPAQAEVAFEACRRFGKGMRSKASLSYCDRIVYALAKSRNAPLLFKGADFTETDIVACGQESNP